MARHLLDKYGDLPQPSFRLVPLPPATKRVRLDQVPGHRLPGQSVPVENFTCIDGIYRAFMEGFLSCYVAFTVADDGTVEVQA